MVVVDFSGKDDAAELAAGESVEVVGEEVSEFPFLGEIVDRCSGSVHPYLLVVPEVELSTG